MKAQHVTGDGVDDGCIAGLLEGSARHAVLGPS